MKPFTYRYLDIPNADKIEKELSDFILPYCKDKPTGLWSVDLLKFFSDCPESVEYLKSAGLFNELRKVCYIVVHPGAGEKDAHVDRNIEPPLVQGESSGCLAINFGIQNQADTPVIFYEYISGPKEYFSLPDPAEGSYIFYAKSELKEIDRYLLTTPALINTTVPHSIYNNTDKTRISVTFRFNSDPWHLTQTNQS
jgi:hypothetical protein